MRIVQMIRMLALCSLLVTAAWVYAQDAPKQEEPRPEAAKPAQQDEKPARQDEAKPAKPDDNKRDDKAVKQDDKASKQEDKANKAMKQDDAKSSKQGSPVAQSGQDQRGGNQRGGRIPDDKFRTNFGREHKFAIHQTTVQGRPGFQYGGYSFIIVDAWPADWAYTDECYVDYIDGEYFLFDLAHPGVQIALTVVM